MALNIEGASVGYDEGNIKKALHNVHQDCVEKTKTALRNNLSTLNDEVNACWVGKSAETFKGNMQHDVDEICKGLDAAYEGLEAEFNKILAGLAEIDQTVLESRS